MDIAKLAEFLGAWLKELIKTFIEAMDWLEINFGGETETETTTQA